jgi:MFS family permease
LAVILGSRATETFGSFRRRDFTLVWTAAIIAMAGRQMEVIAVSWLVVQLTDGDEVLVSLVGAAALSLAFLSVFAGAVVDRVPRRLLMSLMQFIAMALAIMTLLLLLSGILKVWMVFAIIIGGGAFRTFELPVSNALIIDTVPRERLTNAVALLGLGQNLTQFVGPVVAGFLFTPLTPAGLYGLIALLYLVSGVLALLVRTRNTTFAQTTPREIIRGVGEGLAHVWQRKELLMALVIAAMYNVTAFPFSTALMPIFTDKVLQSGPEVLGLLNGAMGAGAVIGSLVVAGLGNFRRQGWWTVWAVNGWHGSMILFAVVVLTLPGLLPLKAVIVAAMAVKVLTGIGRAGSLLLVMSVLMGNSDPEYRGRMGGLRVLSIQAHFPASWLNGWMAREIGAPMTALTLGIIGTVAVFLCLTSRRLREA